MTVYSYDALARKKVTKPWKKLIWECVAPISVAPIILQPSIREFHQHALLTASPCGLQYESSISTPFSLPSSCGLQYESLISTPFSLLHLAAFNTGVPLARPSHYFSLRPSIREFHRHALLIALTSQPSTHFGYSNSILSDCLWP